MLATFQYYDINTLESSWVPWSLCAVWRFSLCDLWEETEAFMEISECNESDLLPKLKLTNSNLSIPRRPPEVSELTQEIYSQALINNHRH